MAFAPEMLGGEAWPAQCARDAAAGGQWGQGSGVWKHMAGGGGPQTALHVPFRAQGLFPLYNEHRAQETSSCGEWEWVSRVTLGTRGLVGPHWLTSTGRRPRLGLSTGLPVLPLCE